MSDGVHDDGMRAEADVFHVIAHDGAETAAAVPVRDAMAVNLVGESSVFGLKASFPCPFLCFSC